MMTNETFTKGQVEWAIWQALSNYANPKGDPPSILLNRIKRLMDLDRIKDAADQQLAFLEHLPGGQGVNAAFSNFDAFTLLLGIELLDIGLNQADVVFLIRNIRDQLRVQFENIMQDPPPARQRVSAKKGDKRPTYEQDKKRYVDYRVFMLTAKVEHTDRYPILHEAVSKGIPIFIEPSFCHGVEALQRQLNEAGSGFRKTMIFELSQYALLICSFLDAAPAITRGRP